MSRRTLTLAALLAVSIAPPLHGQTAGNPAEAVAPAALPDAPEASVAGTLRGHIVYADGSPVSATEVNVLPSAGSALKAMTDPDGAFAFPSVPAGPFTISAEADAMEPYSGTGVMPAEAALEMPTVTLRIAALVSTVNALTQEQAAEMEVDEQEHQRILGAIPNFLVTYEAEPVPLSSTQKYRLTLRTLFDPANIGVSVLVAGGEQATGSYKGFGGGMAGYGRRFGASFGDGATNILLTDAILPSLLHQDPRYFYKGTGSVRSRLGYVLKQAVEQRGDNGRWQPAWSNTAGDVGSALISNTYYPHQSTSWGKVTGQNFGIAIASQGISNLLQEFVFGRMTTHRQP